MRMGPGKHLKGLTLMGGLVKPEEFDYFHEVSSPSVVGEFCCNILNSLFSLKKLRAVVPADMEMVSIGLHPWSWFLSVYSGLLSGKVIGLPPVLTFGSEELKARVVPEVLQGKKFI